MLHNIPEGMATYAASFDSVVAGAPLAFAIAVHNIPEGLSVAMPLLHATGSKWKAIALGALSGMAEPFGAVLASFVANEDSPAGYFGGLFGLFVVFLFETKPNRFCFCLNNILLMIR